MEALLPRMPVTVDDDVNIDQLLEEFEEMQDEWDASAVWQQSAMSLAGQIPNSRKRKGGAGSGAPSGHAASGWGNAEQVMQMYSPAFVMPEFATAKPQQEQSVFLDHFSFSEAAADARRPSASQAGKPQASEAGGDLDWFGHSLGAKVTTQQTQQPVDPAWQVTSGAPHESLDSHILSFFNTGEFREIVAKVDSEERRNAEAQAQSQPQPQAQTQAQAQAVHTTQTSELRPKPEAPRNLVPRMPAAGVELNQPADRRAVRLAALARYRQKKIDRANRPIVRYKSRKNIADNRPRIKGRFVKTEAVVRARKKA